MVILLKKKSQMKLNAKNQEMQRKKLLPITEHEKC